jgi:hypothetical protein
VTTKTRTNYLVFERDEPPASTPGPVVQQGNRVIQYADQPRPYGLLGYRCIGAVAAADAESAVTAAMRSTRRIGAYAVIEATFLDFTKPGDEVDAEHPALNP